MQQQSTDQLPPSGVPQATDQWPKNRRGLALVTLCLAVLIAQVDTTVVNLATHPIGDYFHAGVSRIQWVLDAYNLTYAALLLTGGLLADLYGRRRLFMTGATIFTSASMLCALAPTIGWMIAGRAIAGLGAALIMPASLAIIRVIWTDTGERARVLGVWAACNGLALAIGPAIGGVLIEYFGWRSIFLLVIPLAVSALALARVSIQESAHPEGRHFDMAAQGLGMLALTALAMAAIDADTAPWHALGAMILSALALLMFIRVEVRAGARAMVPLDLFRQSQFRGAVIATLGMTFGMYGVLFLVPLAWQGTAMLGPTGAGVALMPMALTFVLVSPISGVLAGRIGSRMLSTIGLGVIGCGTMITGLGAKEHDLAVTELGLILTGIGMGLATGPLFGLAVGSVSASRSGSASALINVARMAGATLGVALLGTVFALFQGGDRGLEMAMLAGGSVQLGCTAFLGWSVRPRSARATGYS